jgi:serine/threonine protein kinase
VLLWGQQLADAIACLHDEGIRHGGIRAASVRLVDSQVKLTNFGRTQKVRRIEGKDWPIQEVADLARMLRDDLLSGRELSPPLTGLFERALSADKDVRYTSAKSLAPTRTSASSAITTRTVCSPWRCTVRDCQNAGPWDYTWWLTGWAVMRLARLPAAWRSTPSQR